MFRDLALELAMKTLAVLLVEANRRGRGGRDWECVKSAFTVTVLQRSLADARHVKSVISRCLNRSVGDCCAADRLICLLFKLKAHFLLCGVYLASFNHNL